MLRPRMATPSFALLTKITLVRMFAFPSCVLNELTFVLGRICFAFLHNLQEHFQPSASSRFGSHIKKQIVLYLFWCFLSHFLIMSSIS